MARDQVDMTPLRSRDDLVAWFAQGCKPKSQFRIGTEHEKFAFTAEGRRPVPYEGGHGIRALLEGMRAMLGWEPIMEGPNIIGLADVTGGGAISLEPGGQFELSGAPVETVHQTCSELKEHLDRVKEVAAPLGLGFLGLGMTPITARAEAHCGIPAAAGAAQGLGAETLRLPIMQTPPPAFGGCARIASSFGSVPHPGVSGTTRYPSSNRGATVNSSWSQGNRSMSTSMIRKFGAAAAKCAFIIAHRCP